MRIELQARAARAQLAAPNGHSRIDAEAEKARTASAVNARCGLIGVDNFAALNGKDDP